jgi:hypothetical protein
MMMVFCLKLIHVKGSHARFQLLAVGRRHDLPQPGGFCRYNSSERSCNKFV